MRKQLLEEVKSAQGDYFVCGKSVRYNQLVNSDTTSVLLESGKTYFTKISGTSSIQVGSGSSVSVVGGSDIVINLTDIGLTTITTLTDFNKTDLGKLVQNRYLPYGSGIVSAESPIKFSSENLTPNNFELYYEPATPLTLRGVGDVYSELGKQDNSTILNFASNTLVLFKDSGFTLTTSDGNKTLKFVYNHKYFVAFKTNYASLFATQVCRIGSYTDGSYRYITNSAQYNADGDISYTLVQENYNSATPYTKCYVGVGNLLVNRNVRFDYALIIDLTANNLDTLTAQQFYDTYKNDFPYLASGGNIAKIKDKYQNTSGRVVRNVGTRAYQSGDENNPNYLTDGTTTLFPLATSTTEQYTSVHLPKITKKAQANGIELELQRR